jgi:hypothetical protein
MAAKYLSESEAFPSSECADEVAFLAFEEEVLELSKDYAGDILRIEESVGLGWSGVRGCNSQDRVNAEARAALERWVKDKLFQYRQLDLLRYGNGQGRVSCRSSGGNWGSARRCACSGSLPCFIEFKKKS